ncbi:unnamed protein product, partial [Polarella glacialis]
WRAFGGDFDIKPIAADNPHPEQGLAGKTQSDRIVDIKTLGVVRVLQIQPDGDRLIVNRWRPGHSDLPAFPRVCLNEFSDPTLWIP